MPTIEEDLITAMKKAQAFPEGMASDLSKVINSNYGRNGLPIKLTWFASTWISTVGIRLHLRLPRPQAFHHWGGGG